MSESISSPSSRKASIRRPPKPYRDFPLGPANNGYWQKKINGRLHYFGRWGRIRNGKMERLPGDGWQAALELYQAQKDDLYAGRTPRENVDGLTVADLCNRFLTAKLRRLEAGEISARMFDEYKATTDLLIASFGKNRLVDDLATNDFEQLRNEMSKRWGPVRLGNEVGKVKTVFKYGYAAGIIKNEMRYGDEFKKPSASVMRRHRAKNGERMLTADQCHRLINAAPVQLKAMLLLALNCGFGNHDCATLPMSAIDVTGGWVNYPRPKTGVKRHCPLWPETATALRQAIAERPEPRQDEATNFVFVTARGRSWLSRGIANPISIAARDLMKRVGVHHEGIGLYTLRHVFRTIADGSRDHVAVNHIMGHADTSMAATYREHIDDARLKAVVEHVRAWLFLPTSETNSAGESNER